MVEVVLAMHGTLAESFRASAEMLIGEQEGIRTLGLSLGDSVDDFRERVANTIGSVAGGGGDVLVITDMLSGSPFNCVCSASEHFEFEHLTGINFPLFLEILATRGEKDAKRLVADAVATAPETVIDARKFFAEF